MDPSLPLADRQRMATETLSDGGNLTKEQAETRAHANAAERPLGSVADQGRSGPSQRERSNEAATRTHKNAVNDISSGMDAGDAIRNHNIQDPNSRRLLQSLDSGHISAANATKLFEPVGGPPSATTTAAGSGHQQHSPSAAPSLGTSSFPTAPSGSAGVPGRLRPMPAQPDLRQSFNAGEQHGTPSPRRPEAPAHTPSAPTPHSAGSHHR